MQRGLFPPIVCGEGVMNSMVTYSDLIQIGILVVDIIGLFVLIQQTKK